MFGLSYVKVAIMVAAFAIIGGLYWMNSNLRSENASLHQALGAAQVSMEQQVQDTHTALAGIEEWKVAHETLIARLEQVQQVERDATAESRRLEGILSKHDLTADAEAKPGLIQRRINAGTARAFGLLESITRGNIQGASSDD